MWNWLLLWNTDWAYTLRFWWRRVQTALKCTLSYRDGFTCISALLCWFCCPSFAQILQTVLHSVAFRIQVFAFVMLRLLPDILTNASNQDPTMGTGEKDQTSRTRFWIWVAGSRSGSERRLHGALLLLASGDGQHFRATYAASQCKVERDTNIHEPLYTNHDLLATRQVNVKVLFLKNISCSAGRTSKKFWICFWRVWRMMLPPYVRLPSRPWAEGLSCMGLQWDFLNCRRPKQSRSILDLPIQRFCCHLWRRPVLVSWCPAETSTCKMLWYVLVSRWWKIIGQKYAMITDDFCCFSVVLWAFPSTRVCLMWPGSFDMVLCS